MQNRQSKIQNKVSPVFSKFTKVLKNILSLQYFSHAFTPTSSPPSPHSTQSLYQSITMIVTNIVNFAKNMFSACRRHPTTTTTKQKRNFFKIPLRCFKGFSSTRDQQSDLPKEQPVTSLRDLPIKRFGDRPCISLMDSGCAFPVVLSHTEVHRLVEAIVIDLRDAGVGPKTVCALVLPNSLEAVICLAALQHLGATTVPVDPNLDEPLLTATLSSVSASFVISPMSYDEQDKLHEKVTAVSKACHMVHWMIGRTTNKAVYLQMSGGKVAQRSAMVQGAEDVGFESTGAAFQFSSAHPVTGLTVPISQRAVMESTKLFVDTYNMSEEHSTILVLPLHSIHGLISMFASLICGGHMVIADKQTLDGNAIADHIMRMKLNWIVADIRTLVSVFNVAYEFRTDPTRSPIRTLQFIRCIDGELDKRVLEKVSPLISGPILHSYGTTETCGLVTTSKRDEPTYSSFGKTVGDFEVQIFDRNTRLPVRCDTYGLIGVRGGHLDISTDKIDMDIIRTCFAEVNGKTYFLTGDNGSMDNSGALNLYIVNCIESDRNRFLQQLEEKMENIKVRENELSQRRKLFEKKVQEFEKKLEDEEQKNAASKSAEEDMENNNSKIEGEVCLRRDGLSEERGGQKKAVFNWVEAKELQEGKEEPNNLKTKNTSLLSFEEEGLGTGNAKAQMEEKRRTIGMEIDEKEMELALDVISVAKMNCASLR